MKAAMMKVAMMKSIHTIIMIMNLRTIKYSLNILTMINSHSLIMTNEAHLPLIQSMKRQ